MAHAQTTGAKKAGIIGIACGMSTITLGTLKGFPDLPAMSSGEQSSPTLDAIIAPFWTSSVFQGAEWPEASATAAFDAAPIGPRKRRTRARAVSLRRSTSAAAGPER
jgi:hypothetical protein